MDNLKLQTRKAAQKVKYDVKSFNFEQQEKLKKGEKPLLPPQPKKD